MIIILWRFKTTFTEIGNAVSIVLDDFVFNKLRLHYFPS